MNFNKVLLMGNLTRDPQMKYLPSQTAVAEFGIAINRKWKTQQGEEREEVTFVDCSAFGRTAEVINQYFQKGAAIFVEGRLKFDQWEDKNGGGKRSKLSIAVETFQFVGGRRDGQQGSQPQRQQPSGRQQGSRAPSRQNGPPDRSEPPFGDDQHFADADIPF